MIKDIYREGRPAGVFRKVGGLCCRGRAGAVCGNDRHTRRTGGPERKLNVLTSWLCLDAGTERPQNGSLRPFARFSLFPRFPPLFWSKNGAFPSVSERSFNFLPRELGYDTAGISPAKPHWEGETATVHATVAVGWG